MNLLAMLALTVILTWTDNSSNEDGFRIYREVPRGSFVELGIVPVDVVTFTDATALAGGCYKVMAFNLGGESEPSNTVCLPLPPVAPSGLQARPVK